MTRLHTAPLVLASTGPKRPAGTQHPRATTGLQKAAIVGSTSGLGSRSGTDRHHPSRSREGRQGSDTGPGSPHVPAPHAQRAPEATCFQACGTQTLDPAAPQGGSGACGGLDQVTEGQTDPGSGGWWEDRPLQPTTLRDGRRITWSLLGSSLHVRGPRALGSLLPSPWPSPSQDLLQAHGSQPT